MDNNSIYILLSKQNASFRHLDVIANNIANSSTVGKKQQNILYQPFTLNDGNNKIEFTNDIATYRNKANGSFRITENPLDFAIEGEGYFAIQTPTRISYTRAGNFKINQNNQLATFDNYPVLGQGNQPILFQSNDVGITVDSTGMIRSTNREVGQLTVVRFNNDNALEEIGNNRYSTTEQSESAQNFQIVQFGVEESNIDSVGQLTNMMTLQQNATLTKNIMDILEQIEQRSIDELTGTVKG